MYVHFNVGMGVESHALGKEMKMEDVIDQAWFCEEVAATNKLEFLKWAREVKQCEWDEKTIKEAAAIGNLEMLKYCFSNGCPCDKRNVVLSSCYWRTPRLSSISFRKSETFARYGRRSGNTSNMRWSRGDLEIFRRRKKDI